MMVIHEVFNKDVIRRQGNAILVEFKEQRNILTTSPLNGGYRRDMTGIFNYDCKSDVEEISHIKMPTYKEQLEMIAVKIGLEVSHVSGMSTAASMENVSIQEISYEDVTVTAVVTGGIDVNGGRVGDRALWHEIDGQYIHIPGTINIMLFIHADLPPGAMARALVTATEAKTAAIQELMAPSRYSTGLATGSGTDGTIIISNPQSSITLMDAGKHTKLGEMIGKTVMAAVKEALYLETGICKRRQFNVIRRLERFGITIERLWELVTNEIMSKQEFEEKVEELATNSTMVIYSSLLAHLFDQIEWKLIDEQDGIIAGIELMMIMGLEVTYQPFVMDELIQLFSEAFARKLTERR